MLPRDTFVDVEAAFEALHRARAHVAEREWAEAWGPSGVAYHVASRPLLQGHDRPWLDEWRRRLDEVRLSGLECFAAARLGLGGPSLPQAEECGRRLIELAPYRETGYRILMEALEQRGNTAEALLAFDRLRVLLHDELGIAPSPAVQNVHRRLLGTDQYDGSLDLLGLREDVLARNLADQVGVVGAEVILRLLPELVIVVALDDVSAHAINLLHSCIVRPGRAPRPTLRTKTARSKLS